MKLIFFWFEDFVISSATWEAKFKMTDTKPYVSVVTLSAQDNSKLKKTINRNKYQPENSTIRQNQYLGFWIDPGF